MSWIVLFMKRIWWKMISKKVMKDIERLCIEFSKTESFELMKHRLDEDESQIVAGVLSWLLKEERIIWKKNM